MSEALIHGPLPQQDMKKYQNSVARLNNWPRHEKPKWFDRELAAFRGYDSLTGKPRYRCVFGQDPETMIFSCGKWCFKYRLGTAHQKMRFALRGQPIVIDGKVVGYFETDLIDERWLNEPIGLPYYFIEKLTFPRCTEEYWERNFRWDIDIAHGRRDDILGPFPRHGYYEKFLQLVNRDYSPAPPSQRTLDQVMHWIVLAEEEEERERQFSIEQQIQREMDADAAYQERLDEQCRQDLLAAFRSIKLQALGHAVSFPGARVGAGMNAT